mmetsp:Transcript_58178/g.127209  ORF Transcript_58178/g.127209 Transcript_58178/m.127209 type:complete len:167 (-) Transcript_58178:115-615(-)
MQAFRPEARGSPEPEEEPEVCLPTRQASHCSSNSEGAASLQLFESDMPEVVPPPCIVRSVVTWNDLGEEPPVMMQADRSAQRLTALHQESTAISPTQISTAFAISKTFGDPVLPVAWSRFSSMDHADASTGYGSPETRCAWSATGSRVVTINDLGLDFGLSRIPPR